MKATRNLSQADETVVLPRAVREAAARTDALVAEIYPTEPAAPEAPTLIPEPIAAAPEPPAPAPAAPEPAPAEPTEGNWESRYKSLKGRFDRQAVQINDLVGQVNELQRAPKPAATPAAPSVPASKLITEQEETEYGAEFLNVVGKKVRDEVGGEVAELRATVASMASQLQGVTQVTTMTAREKLLSTLDADLPGWRDTNVDQKFLSWLQLPDPLSGVTRSQLLGHAYERNEASRVLAFFNGFLSEEAATAPHEPTLAPTPEVTPGGKLDLASLAAPGRAKTAAANDPAPAEKPIITTAQITKFYADVSAGKYRGREAQKDADEAMIFAAQADGRIR